MCLEQSERNGNKYGYINKNGKEVVEAKYSSAVAFSEGLAAVMNSSDKWGFIDDKGKTVIPFNLYLFVENPQFKNGYVVIWKGKKAGRLNKKGVLTPFEDFIK